MTQPDQDARPLAGRLALVTGATSGIGRATALALAAAGAAVVVHGMHEPRGQDVVAAIREAGGEARFVTADVTVPDDVARLITTAAEWRGRLDCAVNNAGVSGSWTTLLDVTEEEFERVLDVNVKGVWRCLREELRVMLGQGHGAIVNMASVAGLVGTPALPAYGASKHAVVSLTRSAALAFAGQGVRVNAVCPAFIDTPMVERFIETTPRLAEGVQQAQPLGRIGRSEEVAAAIVWLCSDAASFVTGAALPIDGGLTAR